MFMFVLVQLVLCFLILQTVPVFKTFTPTTDKPKMYGNMYPGSILYLFYEKMGDVTKVYVIVDTGCTYRRHGVIFYSNIRKDDSRA